MTAILLALLAVSPSNQDALQLSDEGVRLGSVRRVNCSGENVTCTRDAATQTGTITVTGGASAGANTAAATVDFGSGDTTASVVVTDLAWVTVNSVIVCAPTMLATASRAEGAEDAIIEGLTVAVANRVAGVGFTLKAAPAQGQAFGQYIFHCTGA